MTIRAPHPEDLDAVLELIVARDVADLGAPDYTRADLEQAWAEHGAGLVTDARLAIHDGAIRGYAAVRRADAQVIVHPGAIGHGLGSTLLDWSEARERELGRTVHRRDAAATDTAGDRLLTAAGYARARSFWRMQRSVEGARAGDPPWPAPPLPDGVDVRGLDLVADARAVHALDERAFSANADYVPSSFDAFRRRHLEAHSTDPGLSLVAHAGDVMVGFVLTHRWAEEDTGYVGILAVDPARRRAGLGRSLLGAAFGRIAAAGLGTAQLSVASDNPQALTLYESMGMSIRFQIDSYEKAAR